MKYYLIAGEASGDLHGSNLMKGLLRSDPQAEFRFWGGDLMAAVGGREHLAKHYRDASFFGIGEIVRRLPTVLAQIRECKRDIVAYAPDVLVLIDYPGFNFRMAKFAHGCGIRVFYYISPKVWAWKEHRVERIRRYVDKLFIIFPFEVEYFARRGIDAVYEGNPLMDAIAERCAAMPPREEFFRANGFGARSVIALLAGSRRSEVRNNLPFMAALAELMPEYDFVLAAVPWLDRELYGELLAGSRIICLYDKTYEIVRYADAAVVTSGTATLETALIGTPEVVCYRTDALTVWAGRRLLKIPYISLVNLVMGREVVKELIQQEMTPERAAEELRAILPGGGQRERMLADYDALRKRIDGPGASERVAARMVALLKGEKAPRPTEREQENGGAK